MEWREGEEDGGGGAEERRRKQRSLEETLSVLHSEQRSQSEYI